MRNRDGMNAIKVNYSARQLELALGIAQDLQKATGGREPWTSYHAYLNLEARVDYIRRVESALGVDLRRMKVLEIGSGMGLFVVAARKTGIDCVGIEPGANSYQNLRAGIEELLRTNGVSEEAIQQTPGERLPWPDDSFDVVVSFQVLEHVASPPRTLSEMVRVLKPGGSIYMDMPNHFSFAEGHFGLIWCPLLAFSKVVSRQYVFWCGKNPAFLNELNLITPWRVKRWMRGLDAEFTRLLADPQGQSPSTANRRAVVHFPPNSPSGTGQRFGPVGRFVRRVTNQPQVARLLGLVGMTDHLIWVGRKPFSAEKRTESS